MRRYVVAGPGATDHDAMQEMTIRIAPEMKAEIARVAAEEECSLADVMRQALRDWASRRAAQCTRDEGRAAQ